MHAVIVRLGRPLTFIVVIVFSLLFLGVFEVVAFGEDALLASRGCDGSVEYLVVMVLGKRVNGGMLLVGVVVVLVRDDPLYVGRRVDVDELHIVEELVGNGVYFAEESLLCALILVSIPAFLLTEHAYIFSLEG